MFMIINESLMFLYKNINDSLMIINTNAVILEPLSLSPSQREQGLGADSVGPPKEMAWAGGRGAEGAEGKPFPPRFSLSLSP